MKIDNIITLSQLARETELHTNTIYRYIRENLISFEKLGTRYVFDKKKVLTEIENIKTNK